MRQFTFALYLLVVIACGVNSVDWDVETPLDAYVNRFDPDYSYTEVAVYNDDPDFSVHVLNMTSQKWKDESFSDVPVWWHYLSIFIPKATQGVVTDAAVIFIGGGDYDSDSLPTMSEEWMRRMGEYSRNLKTVTAYLKFVPFQPIRFADSTYDRREDYIIGHTWKMYIEDPDVTPDPEVVVLLPMVKAAKKALDTIDTFTHAQDPKYQVNKFLPTGFSKRGWTTWLLGAVDRRVFAMAPTVFDMLDFQANLEHHYRGLGGWSWAFYPYWFEDVSKYLYHPRFPDLMTFIDPLSFVERLTMPKLLIAASGDQFFPPTGTHYFWDQLLGEKYFQIWENDDHGLSRHLDRRDSTIQAFFYHVYNNVPLPQVSWIRQEATTFSSKFKVSVEDGQIRKCNPDAGRITVTTSVTPTTIQAWAADTTVLTCELDATGTSEICRRDFRLTDVNGQLTNTSWSSSPVLDLGQGQYFAAYDKPSFGYRGFFLQMTYPGPNGWEITFATEVSVVPNDFPYPKCETEEECKGRIV